MADVAQLRSAEELLKLQTNAETQASRFCPKPQSEEEKARLLRHSWQLRLSIGLAAKQWLDTGVGHEEVAGGGGGGGGLSADADGESILSKSADDRLLAELRQRADEEALGLPPGGGSGGGGGGGSGGGGGGEPSEAGARRVASGGDESTMMLASPIAMPPTTPVDRPGAATASGSPSPSPIAVAATPSTPLAQGTPPPLDLLGGVRYTPRRANREGGVPHSALVSLQHRVDSLERRIVDESRMRVEMESRLLEKLKDSSGSGSAKGASEAVEAVEARVGRLEEMLMDPRARKGDPAGAGTLADLSVVATPPAQVRTGNAAAAPRSRLGESTTVAGDESPDADKVVYTADAFFGGDGADTSDDASSLNVSASTAMTESRGGPDAEGHVEIEEF